MALCYLMATHTYITPTGRAPMVQQSAASQPRLKDRDGGYGRGLAPVPGPFLLYYGVYRAGKALQVSV